MLNKNTFQISHQYSQEIIYMMYETENDFLAVLIWNPTFNTMYDLCCVDYILFLPASVRQFADICLFSTAQYKCTVAELESE